MSTPLVLLHPLGFDHHFWDPVRALLPDSVGPVVAPDLPGHGGAPLPAPDARLDELAGTVRDLVAGSGPVHVVGVSLGGLVAQVLAAREPDLVARLVLADTVAVYPEAMRSMWRERAAAVREHGPGEVAEPTEALWFSADFRAGSPDAVAAVRQRLLATDPEGYARTCEVLAMADTTATAGAVVAPTLVACGRDDAPPFRAAVGWFADHLPDARVAWLSGAHASAYEHPGEFAALVADFVA